MVGRHLIVAPEMEALVCDACGKTDYDSATLDWLEALLQSDNSLDRETRAHPLPRTIKNYWFEDWLVHSA